MRSVLTSPIFYFAIILAVLLTNHFSKRPAPVAPTEHAEEATPDFTWLTPQQVEEYYQLKSAKERYEKADELLGKFVLALIAGRFMDVSNEVHKKVKQSANGRHDKVEEAPVCTPVPVAATPKIPVAEPPKTPPPSPTIDPQLSRSEKIRQLAQTFKDNRENPAYQVGQVESFPFPTTALFRNSACFGEGGWFVREAEKANYLTESVTDPVSNRTVTAAILDPIERKASANMTLQHCMPASYAKWQVTVTAYVKGERLRSARFIYTTWAANGRHENTTERLSLSGTFDWKQVTMTLPPNDMIPMVAFGFKNSGSGRLWIRDVTLTRERDLR